jgi:tetratricopeptide (TPR) repeat protein
MNFRKVASAACVAVSCAGCVTETKSVSVSADMAANIKGLKETQYPKREAQPQTWVAVGELCEAKAGEANSSPPEQTAALDEARKAYQKAIDLDPKFVPAHVHLANLYLHKDDPERAIDVYQRAIRQNPKSATLWYEQGMVQCRRKDLNAAIPCLAKAHEFEPNNSHYATNYGLCLARAGRPQDAVIALSSVMNKAEANYNVARMMAHVNQTELSKQYLQAALRERPTHQGALTLLAQLDNPTHSSAGAAVAGGTQTPAAGDLQFDAPLERASWTPPH